MGNSRKRCKNRSVSMFDDSLPTLSRVSKRTTYRDGFENDVAQVVYPGAQQRHGPCGIAIRGRRERRGVEFGSHACKGVHVLVGIDAGQDAQQHMLSTTGT